MKRKLDIIPELLDAVYGTTKNSIINHNGVLYAVKDHIHDKRELINIIKHHGKNILIYSIRLLQQSYCNNDKFIVQYVIINPERVASQCKLRIIK